MVLACLALAVVPVVYEANARALSRHLEAIGKVTGETWTAEPSLGQMVFVIRSRNLSAEQLRDQIAHAAFGKWQAEGSGLRLKLDPAKVEAARAAELKFQVERVRAWQARIREEYAPPYTRKMAERLRDEMKAFERASAPGRPSDTWDQHLATWHRQRAAEKLAPVHRALGRIASLIDPALLADRKPGPKVFTARPNRLQHPLPPGTQAELERLVKEVGLWAAQGYRGKWKLDWGSDPGMYADPLVRDGLTLRIIASPGLLATRLQDKGGRTVGEAQLMMDELIAARPKPVLGPGEAQVSDETEELISYFRLFRPLPPNQEHPNRDHFAVPVGFRERLLRPDESDPLSWIAGPTLLAVAQERGVDLVASLADHAWWVHGALGRKVAFLKLEAAMGLSHVTSLEANVWSIRPRGGMAPVFPRTVLREVMEEARRTGSVSWEALIRRTDFDTFSRGSFLMWGLLELYDEGGGIPGQFGIPELLWRLSAAERESLRAGNIVRMDASTGRLRTEVERMMLDEAIYLRPLSRLEEGARPRRDFVTDVLVLPDLQITLSLKGKSEEVAFAGVGQAEVPTTPVRLAGEIHRFRRSGESTRSSEGDLSRPQYRMGTVFELELSVLVHGVAEGNKGWTWQVPNLSRRPGRYEELPDWYRAEVEKELRKLEGTVSRKKGTGKSSGRGRYFTQSVLQKR